jgi:hypothetical protein
MTDKTIPAPRPPAIKAPREADTAGRNAPPAAADIALRRWLREMQGRDDASDVTL